MIGMDDFKRVTEAANEQPDKDAWMESEGIDVPDFDARAERVANAMIKRAAGTDPISLPVLFCAAYAIGFELAWRLQDERYEGPQEDTPVEDPMEESDEAAS